MKYIKGELLQKAGGRKRGKYRITIEVTDYDIEMFEEFGMYATASTVHDVPDKPYKKMDKYLRRFFYKTLHRLWREFD